MQVMIKRCACLDVHQATVVACLLVCEGRKRTRREVRHLRDHDAGAGGVT
jgi:hypothetical protein